VLYWHIITLLPSATAARWRQDEKELQRNGFPLFARAVTFNLWTKIFPLTPPDTICFLSSETISKATALISCVWPTSELRKNHTCSLADWQQYVDIEASIPADIKTFPSLDADKDSTSA
jgi:hypothetical protein